VEHGIEVIQPADVRDPRFLSRLQSRHPEVAVVVAFGQIFPRQLLEMPPLGCVNLHASLLPRYRGAAPIQAAIVAGETSTGVTTMRMDAGLDTGPILLQREVAIGPEETAGQLADRLAIEGAQLMVRTLRELEVGRIEPVPQAHAEASLAPRLRRSDGVIDWRQEAARIFNLLRGLTPWPGVSTRVRQQPVKILWGRPTAPEKTVLPEPGRYLGLREDRLLVGCGEGTVFGVEELQRPGRKAIGAVAFANGEHLDVGERLG
jgi:methionyl-tRNA formyltransferase